MKCSVYKHTMHPVDLEDLIDISFGRVPNNLDV